MATFENEAGGQTMTSDQTRGVSDLLSQCHVKKAFVITLMVTLYFTVKSLVIVTNMPNHRSYPHKTTIPKLTTFPKLSTRRPGTTTAFPNFLLTEFDNCTAKHLLDIPKVMTEQNCANCANLTCRALLTGSGGTDIYDRTRTFMATHDVEKATDEHLVIATRDCAKFKSDYGYRTKPASEEEADFPIAFTITVHTQADMIERLLRALYHPQNVYCIHVDLKSSRTFHNAIKSLASCFPNVFLPSKLEKIVYAGFSRLQADINCMKDLLKHTIKWKYLMNTAGQAFPLKTNREMVKVLKIYNGANDIEGIYGPRIDKGRFVNEWQEVFTGRDSAEMNKTGQRNPPPPHDIEIVRGSAYGIFSRAFVRYIITDEKAKDLLEWSRKTYSPDEHYWATLHHTYSNPHLHSPGSFSGEPNEKPWLAVFVAWGGVDKCHGMWRRGTCVFGVEDLPNLVKRREFMVNKFHSAYQPITVDCLAAWIEYKSQCPPKFDYDYYNKLPFIIKS